MSDRSLKASSGRRLVRVIHRVNQKLVFSDCHHVRDSNVGGFIELVDVVASNLGSVVGEEHVPATVDSLVLPKLVVVAICYPGDDGERVVRLHPHIATPSEAESEPQE